MTNMVMCKDINTPSENCLFHSYAILKEATCAVGKVWPCPCNILEHTCGGGPMKCSCESCEVFLLGPPEGTLGWLVVMVVVVVEYSMIGGGPSERTGKEVGPLNAITLPPGVQIMVSSVSELSAIRLLQQITGMATSKLYVTSHHRA